MHIAWPDQQPSERRLQSRLRRARKNVAAPFVDPAENGRGALNVARARAREIAGVLALMGGPDHEILAMLRIAANAGEALFSSFRATEPLRVHGVWSEPVTIPPQEHWSLSATSSWLATIGLLVLLDDEDRLARMRSLGADLPSQAPGIHSPPYFRPLAHAWTDLANGVANPEAIQEALEAEVWDPPIFAEQERPHLLAMQALIDDDVSAFDQAMATFFEGYRRRHRKKHAFPELRLSPVGLGLLALARRQGLPSTVTSDFAPLLLA